MVDFNTFNDTDSPENNNISDGVDPTLKVTVDALGNLFTLASQGAPSLAANAWFQRITDGNDIAKITSNQDLSVSDGLRGGGVYGVLNLATSGTRYEAKVGASRLPNRKSLIIFAEDDIYWGYNNSVTTANGILLKKNQQISFDVDPDSTFQVWLVAGSNSKTARIAESA